MKLGLLYAALVLGFLLAATHHSETWFCDRRTNACCLREVDGFSVSTGCGSPETCSVQQECWRRE